MGIGHHNVGFVSAPIKLRTIDTELQGVEEKWGKFASTLKYNAQIVEEIMPPVLHAVILRHKTDIKEGKNN